MKQSAENIRVRTGRPADRRPLSTLVGKIRNFSPEERDVAREVIDAALRDPRGRDYRLRCAGRKNGIAGFVVYGPTPCTRGTWDMYWIAVSPDDADRGIGSLLLAEAEKDMRRRGARLVVVETASKPSYDATRAFYDRRGYRVEARIRNLYAPGDDQIIYVKRFGSVSFRAKAAKAVGARNLSPSGA